MNKIWLRKPTQFLTEIKEKIQTEVETRLHLQFFI